MACPCCFGDFDYWDDYCYFDCPYSYECEDEYYGYYDDYYDDYDDYWDDYYDDDWYYDDWFWY